MTGLPEMQLGEGDIEGGVPGRCFCLGLSADFSFIGGLRREDSLPRAVDYECRLWVNGQEAGTHRGGYVSFSFDITKYAKEGVNTLTLYARDDTRSGNVLSAVFRDRYSIVASGLLFHGN